MTTVPVVVTFDFGTPVRQLACGAWMTAALTETGEVMWQGEREGEKRREKSEEGRKNRKKGGRERDSEGARRGRPNVLHLAIHVGIRPAASFGSRNATVQRQTNCSGQLSRRVRNR